MFDKSVKKIKALAAVIAIMLITVSPAFSQEITAINFNGDLIGKVIPDGTVVSFDNEIIGNITADSFIVNGKGELIGGIVPQGVAIGNDNKLLGRVSNDGTVRLPSGKIVGKVLPTSLVVDDAYNILGSVLYPGLVYDDEGKTVGRLTGDGLYISLEGQNIGFVSATGHAYRNTGKGFVLDGKLISSKMIVSAEGKFIGSITAGGVVTDFSSNPLGQVHANGYVYDKNNQVIGKTISKGYAFDNYGQYLGLVTYNGEVLSQGDIKGRLRADGKIINNEAQVIGFAIDISATASDFNGKYLGRVIPGGQVVYSGESVGTVGAGGYIWNKDGAVIGRIIKPGPVFDYLGELKGQTAYNGTVVSLLGAPIGYAKGKIAYDNIGRILGSAMDSVLVYDNADRLLGLSGIGSEIKANNQIFKVSPFGYVYSADNLLAGHTVDIDAVYDEAGRPLAYIGISGELQNIPAEKNYQITQFGLVTDSTNRLQGAPIKPYFAVGEDGRELGVPAQNNLLLDKQRKVSGKIVPEYKVTADTENGNNNQMPIIGGVGRFNLALGIGGDTLGYVDLSGKVRDYSGNVIGQALGGETIGDVKKSVIGRVMDLQGVVNDQCSFVGIVGQKGEVRNSRDVILGKILNNNQVISEVGNVVGFGVPMGLVTDFTGNSIGHVNALGRVINYNREDLGCIRHDGRLYDKDGKYLARRVVTSPIMNFENQIIGRSNLNGRIIDEKSADIGYITPDGSAVSSQGTILGTTFNYKVAFSEDNSFLGRVLENGTVVSDKDDVLGKVLFDGTVVSEDKPIGYALYDFYIYDGAGKAIGYLSGSGEVLNFAGNKLGRADKGFLVDAEKDILRGRGRRDYFIRDDENKVIGELSLNGEVIGLNGKTVGKLGSNGEILSDSGEVIGKARELQYYTIEKPEPVKPADWATTQRGKSDNIQMEAVPVAEETEESKYGLKTVGIALTPDGNYLGDILVNNDVIDKLGNLIGKKMPDGLIVDNQGGLIGIEEAKGVQGGQMFIPAGTFGSGGAYGTGNNPANLGPGGGFGPGERYDPVRSRALAMAQNARREEIVVGKISSNEDPESFDGKQAYWKGVPRQISSWRVDMSEMILADKPIPAVLARTIMSSNGADNVPVTAIVERNVYAETGRNIVIPAGSRVMGTSSGGAAGGSGAVRVSITWTRLIRPDGSAFEFSSAQTGDAQGRGGALGYIDEQLVKKYTLPMITNLLSSAVAYVAASGETTTTADGGTVESARQEASQDARENFLDNMDTMFNQILADKTDIAAVTYVPAGTRLIIYPKEDLWIRTRERTEEESLMASNKPTVFLDDRDPTGELERSSGGNAGGNSSSGTGTGSGTSGVVYVDNSNAEVQGTPLIDETDTGGKNKKQTRPTGIPPVTSTGATPPPPSSTAGVNNTSAQLF